MTTPASFVVDVVTTTAPPLSLSRSKIVAAKSPIIYAKVNNQAFVINPKRSLVFFVILFFSSCPLQAASDFYYLNDRWQKSNVSEKPKGQAIEDAFSSALFRTSGSAVAAPAPALNKTLSEVIQASSLEIEQGQSLFVSVSGGIVKFISTDEGILNLEASGSSLRITGAGIGRSFVHVWDGAGRHTFEIKVKQPIFVQTQYQKDQFEKFEKSRSFKITYENNRNAFYTGDKFQDKRRSSLDFSQKIKLAGDTPYGALESQGHIQNNRGEHTLDEIYATLEDGKIGPFKNFDLALGDTELRPDLIVFPQGRIRGGHLKNHNTTDRLNWESFYGRQNASIFGVLAVDEGAKQTVDSYLSGNILDYQLNSDTRVKTALFTGHGQWRDDNLNRKGFANVLDRKFGPHTKFHSETNFDNEHFADKNAVTVAFKQMTIKQEVRDISKKFFTMIGSPGQQGEIGYRLDLTASPSDQVFFMGDFDIFRDRLIPNPDDLDALNRHTDLMLRVVPYENASLALSFNDADDTGRVGPTRQRTYAAQFNQKFDIWDHSYTVYSRLQNRDSTQLTNAVFNYTQNQATLGLYTQLFWGINFSLQQEWNILDEHNAGGRTYPRALVYNLDYSRQLGATPFSVNMHLRIRDEEDTESPNSFMGGEDSTEIAGGINYRSDDETELFVTGSFTNYKPESLDVTEPRVEAQVLTGMKHTFDTGVRWSAVGDFDGFVFKDVNGDGEYQPGEPGLPDIMISASDDRKVKTDAKGYYRIDKVAGKRTTLSMSSDNIPYGYAPTKSTQQEMEIVANQTQRVNFGLTPRSEITGIVFNDLNGNGKYDLTDVGLKRIRVSLESGTVARSNELGVYAFSSVVAGQHTVSLVLATLPQGYLPVDAPKKTITVFEGIRFEQNFPIRAMRALTGRVLDASGNPLENVKIHLGDQEVISDKEGWYLFDSIQKGHFELSVDASSLQAGSKLPENKPVDFSAEPITMTDVNIVVGKS